MVAGILQPPGQAQGKRRGSAGCVCCNSGGKVSARPPSLRSREPLYTKQPPQPGLNFREAVSEEAAARDFSMHFQVKSKPFRLCQETTPLSHSGCLSRARASRPRPPRRPTPDSLPRPHWCPRPMPGTFLLSVPHPLQLSLRREPCDWSQGAGRGAEKGLIPWLA